MAYFVALFLTWFWGFLWGAYIFFVLNFQNVASDFFKIKISDIMNSTVALILAVSVTYYLNKKSSFELKVKELFIARLSSITTVSSQTYELCCKYDRSSVESKNEWQTLVLLISQLSKHLSALLKHAKIYNIKILCSENIKHSFLSYKSAITGDKIDVPAATQYYLELLSSLEKAKLEILTC